MEFQLKDGRSARTEVWSFSQLEAFLETAETTGSSLVTRVAGFSYMCPNLPRLIKMYGGRRDVYAEEEKLSPMEMQEDRTLPNEQYSKSVVALHEGKPIGFLTCHWLKDNIPFWRYYLRHVDTHSDFRNQGVATQLFMTRDE